MPAAHVLLVAPEWKLRALVRAQLIEEGYDVMALESWDEAELLLRTRAVTPDAVVVQLDESAPSAADLQTLARIVAPERVLVLTSLSMMPVADVRARGFRRALTRPFGIAEIVQAVGEMTGNERGRSS